MKTIHWILIGIGALVLSIVGYFILTRNKLPSDFMIPNKDEGIIKVYVKYRKVGGGDIYGFTLVSIDTDKVMGAFRNITKEEYESAYLLYKEKYLK